MAAALTARATPAPRRRWSAVLLAALAALWLALAVAPPALAQTEPDYQAWNQIASRAEDEVDAGGATTETLQRLRADIVSWRDRFLQAQSLNAPRIATLRDQISALGPAPAEGETEAPEIAERRKELTEQLAQLQAPGLRAVEAYSRADSLVRAIDETARTRQADAILKLSPSPLLPSSLIAAASEGMTVLNGIAGDVRDRTYGAAGRALIGRLPLIGLYLALALGLLIYGRRWIDSLPSRLGSRASDYARDAVAFAVSLGQIAIPTAGAYLLVRALDTTGLAGSWARPLLMVLPVAALLFFTGRWLSLRFFTLTGDPPICYPEVQRQRGQFYGISMAAALAVHHIAGQAVLPLSGIRTDPGTGSRIPLEVSDAAAAVWHLPLIVVGALLLFRLGLVLRHRPEHDASEQTGYAGKVMAALGAAARLIALASPVLAVIGFVTLANSILWPAALTIGLAMLVIVLQEFATDLWSVVKRDRGMSRNALAPVLIGFGLVVLAMPLLALIWGASNSDLGEAWTSLRNGFSLGGVKLSPGAVLTFVVVFTLGYMATRVVQGTVRTSILPRTRLDIGAKNAVVSGLGYVGIFLSALLAVTSAGIDLSSLAILAGALSVGIGFGLQNIVSNFVSGIILLVERPVAVGDWIQVGQSQGYVKRISVRSTQIQTFDRTDVIVPNSDLISKEVTNWTRGNLQGRIIIKVGVAYGSDTRRVVDILREIAEDQPTVLINPAPNVLFMGFGADSLDFEIRAILSDINQGMGVQSEIRHQIIERFAAEGIEIPFAHREVRIVNAEELGEGGKKALGAPAGPGAPAAADDAEAEAATARPRGEEQQDPRITQATSSGLEIAEGGSDGDGDGDRG